jgi:sec-independent protein translocase protein TatC
MPFLDHLEELRWRILKCLLAIGVGLVIAWVVLDKVDLIELLKRPIAPYLPGGRLVFTSPAEPFMLTLKVAFGFGCVLVSPVLIYQIWAFLAPALYERERRLIVPALAVGAVLFLAGAIACYEWLLPAALKVLLGFSREDLTPMITIDRYFGMAVPFIVASGAIAELPLVMTILAALGLVTPQFLARQRRYAFVISAFVAALLTPPDAVSMMLMLIPLALLYEISIWCAWVASRRRARREATAGAGAGAALLVLLQLGAGPLAGQVNPPPSQKPPPLPADPTPDTLRTGRALDTAAARKLGLPTGPTRSFPQGDPVIDSLLKLHGFRITRYVAETLVVQGDSQTIFLRREAFVEREGTQVEADSIRYREATCRLDAAGDPKLFDQGTVLVGEEMRYDTCLRRGTVRDALTDFRQGGATWYTRGRTLAVDSASSRVYGAGATFTSDPQPVPDYHFAAGEMKWLNKSTMVARPVVLYVRDVPVMWLPFIFQDIRSGRRSGILVPRFGLNDLVRPTRGYRRQISNFGYYFVLNNYADLLVSGDWYAGRYLALRGESSYRWLDRFVQGRIAFTRTHELDQPAHQTSIAWNHSQTFNSRTHFNADVQYSTSAVVVLRNSLDPNQATASLRSGISFEKRFDWGTLNIGGSRGQELSSAAVSQTFPDVRLAPSAVNITPWLSWSPGFTLANTQTLHNAAGTLLVPAPQGDSVDAVPLFANDRRTTINVQTPIRIGRWNWGNTFSVLDVVSTRRQEFVIPDSTVPGGVRRATYAQTFSTEVDWQTSINLPGLLMGTWKLQPGIGIINTTSGPFMLKNQFSGGEFVQQGKRLAFNASLSPAFFGFFPGVGPLQRIRHSISPLISYQYAPGVKVPEAYARALDPTGKRLDLQTDPQQTISLGLSQNIEAKLKPRSGDTTSTPRKIRLLSINTSSIGYNFEQAKQAGLVGWQTSSLTNTFASDLLPGGISISVTHDLWDGQVGLASTRFAPFLQSVTLSSFTVTAATLRGVAGLFGFGARGPQVAPGPAPDTMGGAQPPPTGALGGFKGGTGSSSDAGGYGGERGRAFSLTLSYSSTRSRGDTTPALRNQSGRRIVNMNMAFSPTRNWSATWTTSYDFATRQFAQHFVRLDRDLHRWHASFAFSKSANGNFAFSFNIALTDQPDIKFDYDQRSYAR